MPRKNYHHGDLENALIQAGIEILSKEGLSGLTLRKVAKRAGVSHSAPYAHFKDRQALVAAISTEGYKQLYAELDASIGSRVRNPKRQLVKAARAYVQFAMDNPDTFKIMFSGVLEKEKEYPSFVEISRRTFAHLVEIVRACQAAGCLPSAPPELMAVSIWGQVYGVILLALEGQISHTVLDRFPVHEIVAFGIEQMSLGKINNSSSAVSPQSTRRKPS